MIVVAVLGLGASFLIPRVPAQDPTLRVELSPIGPMRECFRLTSKTRSVFLSVLGVSWFWFYGSVILSVLPTYTRDVLFANESVVTFFLALFCIGIGVGSLLCEKLSGKKLELGLVPLGTIGMTWFAFDLFLAGAPTAAAASGDSGLHGLSAFLAAPGGKRIAIGLTLLALFSGFFIVPLTTMIQERTDAKERSRVIAGSNILGGLFMVLASLVLVGLLEARLTIPQIFLVLAAMNGAVAFYIYKIIPEFWLRFVAWIIASAMYRLRVVNRERIPLEGPAVLVANHVSFVDWLIVSSACPRPVRFVMHHGFFKIPLMGWFFRDAKVIPIASGYESAATMRAAFDQIARDLEEGELVCIFPEGKITKTGELNTFRKGVERIVARTPVPVIPMALCGLWGSFFSRKGGAAMRRPFRRFWSRIELRVGEAIAPQDVTAEALARRVAELGGLPAPAAETDKRPMREVAVRPSPAAAVPPDACCNSR